MNTYWFDAGGVSHQTMHDAIVVDMEGLYNDAHAPSTDALCEYLSTWVSNTVTVKTYDMNDAEPRIPLTDTFVMSGVGSSGTVNLPEEVAVCVSFHSTPPITARRRGRVFIGPLINTVALDSDNNPARPTTTFRNLIRDSFTWFLSQTSGAWWVIHSEAGGFESAVVAGWVDDAFDTQRRRGPDPTTKTIWPTPA